MHTAANDRVGRRAAAFAIIVVLGLTLGACGRKGPLEPHPDEPRAAPAASQEGGATRGLTLSGGRRTTSSPVRAPDRPFILDGLL